MQVDKIMRGQVQRYVDEMVSMQKAMEDLQHRMQDFRREAKADGLIIPALDFLTSCVNRSPADRGANLLNPLVAYAQLQGSSLEGLPAISPAEEPAAATSPVVGPVSKQYRQARRQTSWETIGAQCSVGLLISYLLLWLLN